MRKGIEVAKEKFGADRLTIEAQTYARKFYEGVGFRKTSEEFLEDGIPHIEMQARNMTQNANIPDVWQAKRSAEIVGDIFCADIAELTALLQRGGRFRQRFRGG